MNDGEPVLNRVTGKPIEGVGLSPHTEGVRPYMYRPDELLVDQADDGAVSDALSAEGFRRVERHGRPPSSADQESDGSPRAKAKKRKDDIDRGAAEVLSKLDLVRWVREDDAPGPLGSRRDVPELVTSLRASMPSLRPAVVPGQEQPLGLWPVYVAHGEPDGEFGPASMAVPVANAGAPPTGDAGRGVRVGFVDTGLFRGHDWLQGAASRGPRDDEILDDNGDGIRDFEASHGSFVAGVILRHAPGAKVIGRAALDSDGIVGDAAIADAIDSLRSEDIDILNLSLGGYAHPDDVEPFPATFRALALLRAQNPRLVVVAAAGNDGVTQEFWPAAAPDVIGVGALTSNLRRACFSNYGPWVDAWAQGVDVQSCFQLDDVTTVAGAIWSGTSFAAPRVAGSIAAAMNPA